MTEELVLGRPLDLRSKKLVMIFETNRGRLHCGAD